MSTTANATDGLITPIPAATLSSTDSSTHQQATTEVEPPPIEPPPVEVPPIETPSVQLPPIEPLPVPPFEPSPIKPPPLEPPPIEPPPVQPLFAEPPFAQPPPAESPPGRFLRKRKHAPDAPFAPNAGASSEPPDPQALSSTLKAIRNENASSDITKSFDEKVGRGAACPVSASKKSKKLALTKKDSGKRIQPPRSRLRRSVSQTGSDMDVDVDQDVQPSGTAPFVDNFGSGTPPYPSSPPRHTPRPLSHSPSTPPSPRTEARQILDKAEQDLEVAMREDEWLNAAEGTLWDPAVSHSPSNPPSPRTVARPMLDNAEQDLAVTMHEDECNALEGTLHPVPPPLAGQASGGVQHKAGGGVSEGIAVEVSLSASVLPPENRALAFVSAAETYPNQEQELAQELPTEPAGMQDDGLLLDSLTQKRIEVFTKRLEEDKQKEIKELETRLAQELETRLAQELEMRLAQELEMRLAQELEMRLAQETSRIEQARRREEAETRRVKAEAASSVEEARKRMAKMEADVKEVTRRAENSERRAKETQRRAAESVGLAKKQALARIDEASKVAEERLQREVAAESSKIADAAEALIQERTLEIERLAEEKAKLTAERLQSRVEELQGRLEEAVREKGTTRDNILRLAAAELQSRIDALEQEKTTAVANVRNAVEEELKKRIGEIQRKKNMDEASFKKRVAEALQKRLEEVDQEKRVALEKVEGLQKRLAEVESERELAAEELQKRIQELEQAQGATDAIQEAKTRDALDVARQTHEEELHLLRQKYAEAQRDLNGAIAEQRALNNPAAEHATPPVPPQNPGLSTPPPPPLRNFEPPEREDLHEEEDFDIHMNDGESDEESNISPPPPAQASDQPRKRSALSIQLATTLARDREERERERKERAKELEQFVQTREKIDIIHAKLTSRPGRRAHDPDEDGFGDDEEDEGAGEDQGGPSKVKVPPQTGKRAKKYSRRKSTAAPKVNLDDPALPNLALAGRKYIQSIGHIEGAVNVDNETVKMFGPPMSSEDLEAWMTGTLVVTPDEWRYDPTRPAMQFDFNKYARKVAVDGFMGRVSNGVFHLNGEELPVEERICDAPHVDHVLKTYLNHIERTYRAIQKNMGPQAKEEALHRGRAYQRKWTLLNSRRWVFDHFPFLEPWKHWFYTSFEANDMSGDETDDPGERAERAKSYKVNPPAWQSVELRMLWRNLDDLYRLGFNLLRRKGNRPRVRIDVRLGQTSGVDQQTGPDAFNVVPRGLPINCYDVQWLSTLLPWQRDVLNPAAAMSLEIPRAMLADARRQYV